MTAAFDFHAALREGLVIPAHPLALNAQRKLDERRQRALSRYYLSAGAGGLAVGVHTTQFAIREARHSLYEPVLTLAMEEMQRHQRPVVAIGGICGQTPQAAKEAACLRERGYHAGLLSLAALADATDATLLQHCREIGQILPIIGFYLQPSVGGRRLSYEFWREFVEIESVIAIKIAPFSRYQTLDVIRAVAESGRSDVALYTGNDDNIIPDLLTAFEVGGRTVHITGGLLGHWSVWTKRAVEHLAACKQALHQAPAQISDLLRLGTCITDCNAAFFDASHVFKGCIAGLHEVLRRQGLLENIVCLDENEGLSPGQADEITRVCKAYPELNDDPFVLSHLDTWLRD